MQDQDTRRRAAVDPSVHPAAYRSLLVHGGPGGTASGRVTAAATLARDLDARLIGVGAQTFDPPLGGDPIGGFAVGEWLTLMQDELTRALGDARAAFLRDAAGLDAEWRSFQDFPSKVLRRMASAADLIVLSPRTKEPATLQVDPAEVVMGSGRPVLLVPDDAPGLAARAAHVAWKPTRECRRAISDAMPFLQGAERVVVHAVCRKQSDDCPGFEIEDTVANLQRHGVKARALVTLLAGDSVTETLQSSAIADGADLIVAGAYGHSRAREWAFGGVTQDLLEAPGCYILLSH